MTTTKPKVSRCCKATLLFESICGMRLYRTLKSGRDVYSARCSKCQRSIMVSR